MTVQELIDRLGQFPPTATVVIDDCHTPYVLREVHFSRRHHVMPFNVRQCLGAECLICAPGYVPWVTAEDAAAYRETVEAVVL